MRWNVSWFCGNICMDFLMTNNRQKTYELWFGHFRYEKLQEKEEAVLSHPSNDGAFHHLHISKIKLCGQLSFSSPSPSQVTISHIFLNFRVVLKFVFISFLQILPLFVAKWIVLGLDIFRSRAFMRKGSLGVTFFPSVLKFLLNYNCGASYDHLWCPNGPEGDWKWQEVDRKWARSGLEVSTCPSKRLSIPNTSLTSLTNLMQGIFKRRK